MSYPRFYKMTGSGNDFIMIDGRTPAPEWTPDAIAAMCDRRTGAGADGLVILAPEAPGEVRMTYFNADGSRAALCGNAALCSTRLAARLGMAPETGMRLLTDAGVLQSRCLGPDDTAEIRLPDFAPPTPAAELAPGIGEGWVQYVVVGVPHVVIRVPEVDAVDIVGCGRPLRFDPRLGPAGANVNFVSPPAAPGSPWRIRTYERGVEGETLACGTGTVAAAAAVVECREAGFPVQFVSRGGLGLGVRAVRTADAVTDVWLAGQGRLVYSAVWES